MEIKLNFTSWRNASFILIEQYGKSQSSHFYCICFLFICVISSRKKESPLRVISNLHSCFLIIPLEITQAHFFFFWWCDNPPMSLILTRFLHFYFSLRSINEHSLQGGVHAKCPTASKLIRNKKACRASGKSSIKWCTLWPLGDHSSAGNPGISFLKNILKPEA